jgi:hypothetical protein
MRLIISAALLIVACQARATTLAVSPSSRSTSLGQAVTASVGISGLGGHVSPSLGTYDLNVAFDPMILSFASVAFGDPILGDKLDPSGLGDVQTTTPGIGTVEVFELSLDSASLLNSSQPPAFTLFQLAFDAIAEGTSPVSITINALGDENGNSLPASIENGSVQVITSSTIPEPSSWATLLCGATLLCIVPRKVASRKRYLYTSGIGELTAVSAPIEIRSRVKGVAR